MQGARTLVAILVTAVVAYTAVTIWREGLDLITPFFGQLIGLGWPGQFNLDFSTYLILSTAWFLWRNDFSTPAIVFAPLVCVGGMLVFGGYLIWLSTRVDGRMDLLLLGPTRAGDRT